MEGLSLKNKYGHFIGGPKKPGETRVLRNINLSEQDELKNNVDGMKNLKEILEARAREVPEKPFLGSRARIVDKETQAQSYGDYEWKNYG